MTKHVLGGLVAVLLMSLAACGGSSDDPGPDAEPTASESAQDDALAGVITDNPEDVTWRLGETPSSWRELQTDQGEKQWQVSSRCVLSVFQPAGLGSDVEPTQEDVLDEYVGRLADNLKTSISTEDRRTRQFGGVSNVDGAVTVKASRARLSAPKGLGGEVYSYRSGDFALVLMTFCGDGTFDQVNESEFEPYIADKVAINATY